MKTIIKKFMILALLVLAATFLTVGCSKSPKNPTPSNEPSLKNFTTINFGDVTLDYDGNTHTIEATGVPEGATVEYTNAGPFVNAGEYNISVKVSMENYNDYTKTATLKINKLNFPSTMTFEDLTLDYDGNVHTIELSEEPEGATVEYTNAGPFVNAGEYTISVKVTKENYNDYTKTAKLKINKIDFPSTIKFENDRKMYTGDEKSILVSGDLPEETQVQYINNKGVEPGKYEASVTLINLNYNTKTLYATLTIYNALASAKQVVDTILSRPDPWSFMPESLNSESLAVTTNPVKDFNSFVNVNDINKKFIGKQMFVLWEGVDGMASMLSKIDVVFAAGETIAAAYQNFINDNPDDCAEWIGSVAGFNIKILVDGSQSTMLVGNTVFSIELFADTEENVNRGRIEIATGGILNYEMRDDYLKFNIALTIKGVLVMKQVEFNRNEDGEVSGYFYEYAGLASAALKTSAVISFNDEYAIVASAKRESEDLLVNCYEEVYSSETGQFVSAEVLENNKLTEFDTFWVNLWDVKGIKSVKAISNGTTSLHENIHDVYVNGHNKIFTPVKNKIALIETSRKFDIEMKTVYYVVATTEGGELTYTVVETEIPMLFVQKKNVEEFSSDVLDKNDDAFDTTPELPAEELGVAEENFESVNEALTEIKEKLTYEELESQLGTRDPFFA